MRREITSHRTNLLNERLRVYATDEPGPGGANHDYAITYVDPNNCERSPMSARHRQNCIIGFQKGPVTEVGINGVSNEALLAIVEDRLRAFQAGSYACHENEMALNHVLAAIGQLTARTRGREARGVEGTSAA